MPTEHKVGDGECILSIALDAGYLVKTIWDDPANKQLKSKGRQPNLLKRGDIVVIPDKHSWDESGATEQTHRFRLNGGAVLRLRLLANGEERANEPYRLEIDGAVETGTTDKNGQIEHAIAPNARKGRVVLPNDDEEYLLDLGSLDPVDEVTGAQERLHNLGLYHGPIDGAAKAATEKGIRAFQAEHGLTVTGKLDESTESAFEDAHGC